MSIAETSQDQSSLASSDSVTSAPDSSKKSESRACKMHIVGGIAMLAIGLTLLVVT